MGQPIFGERSSLIDSSIDCLVRELPPHVVVCSQKDCDNGEATVKTFSRKNGQIWLLPTDDNFAPIDGNNCEILGRVTAVMRSFR